MPDLRRGCPVGLAARGARVRARAARANGAVRPRVVLIAPFDATALGADGEWIGSAVAEALSLGLAQHPAFIQIDRARLRQLGEPEAWGEPVVLQAGRSLRADAALFGTITLSGTDLTIQPRLLEVRAGGGEVIMLEPLTLPQGDLLARLPALVVAYAPTTKVPLTDADVARIEKAVRLTRSLRAFELYARSQEAARRGGQEGNERAADLLSRAIGEIGRASCRERV